MEEVRVLFWNVENFVGGESRTKEVKKHIQEFNPDVFCLCEIKDKVALRSLLMNELTEYDFGLTDGAQGIELLAGWKREIFQQVLFTQRREFKANQTRLRPGSLLNAKINDEWLSFLFLHTDSGTKIKDYQNRQEMFEKIWSMKDVLDVVSSRQSTKLVVMGDLNTMGRSRSGQFKAVSADKEITDLGGDAELTKMKLLDKSQNITLAWKKWPSEKSYRLSNLDHVLATNNIELVDFKKSDGQSHPVQVSGWVDIEDETKRTDFIENISDHCSIRIKISLDNDSV
ncbi:MAG: endonuclease/exonuclease/phosphatase family protein [Allomuricauda sp.]